MKNFSNFSVLVSTLDLVMEAMPQDPRVDECVNVICRCLDSSTDSDELRSAVTTLLGIALQNHQFLIAASLQEIARQLVGADAQDRM